MATVTVLKSPTAQGADALLTQIKNLQTQHLITLVDAAVVSWPAGARAPKTRQLVNVVAAGASSGMFWACCSASSLTPFGRRGAAAGAPAARSGTTIDDSFIKKIRSESPKARPRFS